MGGFFGMCLFLICIILSFRRRGIIFLVMGSLVHNPSKKLTIILELQNKCQGITLYQFLKLCANMKTHILLK